MDILGKHLPEILKSSMRSSSLGGGILGKLLSKVPESFMKNSSLGVWGCVGVFFVKKYHVLCDRDFDNSFVTLNLAPASQIATMCVKTYDDTKN